MDTLLESSYGKDAQNKEDNSYLKDIANCVSGVNIIIAHGTLPAHHSFTFPNSCRIITGDTETNVDFTASFVCDDGGNITTKGANADFTFTPQVKLGYVDSLPLVIETNEIKYPDTKYFPTISWWDCFFYYLLPPDDNTLKDFMKYLRVDDATVFLQPHSAITVLAPQQRYASKFILGEGSTVRLLSAKVSKDTRHSQHLLDFDGECIEDLHFLRGFVGSSNVQVRCGGGDYHITFKASRDMSHQMSFVTDNTALNYIDADTIIIQAQDCPFAGLYSSKVHVDISDLQLNAEQGRMFDVKGAFDCHFTNSEYWDLENKERKILARAINVAEAKVTLDYGPLSTVPKHLTLTFPSPIGFDPAFDIKTRASLKESISKHYHKSS